MWIRKSDEEIRQYLDKEETKANSLLRPFLFALIAAIVAMGLYSLGYRGGWLRGGMILTGPSGFSGRIFFLGLLLFIIFFAIFAYYLRRGSPTRSMGDHLLCSECKEPGHANPSGLCECGGRLEPFGFYNWVEDKPD